MADLTYLQTHHVDPPESEYYWVDMAVFTIEQLPRTGTYASEALELLLTDALYRNSYYTIDQSIERRHQDFTTTGRVPGSREDAKRDTHGPYLWNCISPSAFTAVSRRTSRSLFRSWLRGNDLPWHGSQTDSEDWRPFWHAINSATNAYKLNDLGEVCMHPAGYVTDPFIELVLVNSTESRLHVLAGGTD